MSQRNDRPLVEAALESGEVVADALMRGDALAEIPVIGTAIKICRAADSIRDKIFAAKLAQFIRSFDSLSEAQRQRIRNKVIQNPEEATRVGETLLLVIERMTDLDKPRLLACLFLAYVDGEMTGTELRRLSQAIDVAFVDDLDALLSPNLPILSDDPWMRSLLSSGLTGIVGGQSYDDVGKILFEITPLGHQLLRAYSYARNCLKII